MSTLPARKPVLAERILSAAEAILRAANCWCQESRLQRSAIAQSMGCATTACSTFCERAAISELPIFNGLPAYVWQCGRETGTLDTKKQVRPDRHGGIAAAFGFLEA
jgi:hypothetical protein